MRRNYIVNVPGFFSLVWRIAEPMLSPSTRKKIRLCHSKQVAPRRTHTAHAEVCDENIARCHVSVPHAPHIQPANLGFTSRLQHGSPTYADTTEPRACQQQAV